MTPRERQPLDAYLALDDPVEQNLPEGLVTSANKALRGIDTVSIRVDDLLAAMKQGGLPCTTEELGQRFVTYLKWVMSGRDHRNTRITVEEN